MANKEREALIEEATKLNVEFEKNISTVNLQKRVDEKKEELVQNLKSIEPINELSEDTETNDTQDNQEETETKNELSEETYEDEMIIKRVSKCGGYKTNIKGLKEAARRSGITVKEVKEALESGKPVATGETFTEV